MSIQKPELELLEKASLAATLIASIGATAAMHERYDPPSLHVREAYTERVTDQDNVTRTTEPAGKPHPVTIHVPTPGNPTTKTTLELRFPDSPYARSFDQDPAVHEVDKPAATEIGSIVKGLQNEGWKVRLEVFGQASAEDDVTNPDAGLQTPSVKNIDLANARRDAFVGHLTESGALPEGTEISLLEGREGNLTTEQYVTLEGFADQFGYQSVASMVDAWNLGKDVPPAVKGALDSWLSPDRSVSVSIIAEREVPGKPGETEETVCVLPVRTVETVEEHTQKKTTGFSIPAFLVVPVPIMRRRKGKYSEERIHTLEMRGNTELANDLRAANFRRTNPRAYRRMEAAKTRAYFEQLHEQDKRDAERRRAEKQATEAAEPVVESEPVAEPLSSEAPAETGVPTENPSADPETSVEPTPPEKRSWRLKPIIPIIVSVGIGLGVLASLAHDSDAQPKTGTGTAVTHRVNDPYCPPELRKVQKNTGQVRKVVIHHS